MEFERAATLRDKLQRLEELREQFGRLRFAVETLSFLYTVRGHEGDDRLYLIRRGRVRAEVPTPRTAQDRRSVDAAGPIGLLAARRNDVVGADARDR